LFLEFYAGGNIILTDNDLSILALLRIVSEGPDQEELRVGLKYSLDNRQNYKGTPPLTAERLREALQRAVHKEQDETAAPSKKGKKKAGDALRKAFATSITEYPPTLVEHALRISKFDSSLRPEEVLHDDSLLERLMEGLRTAGKIIQDITSSDIAKGYIFAKPHKSKSAAAKPLDDTVSNGDTDRQENLMYEDFHPFRPLQFQDQPDLTTLEFEGFNKTVDEFFSSIEGQKLESRLTEREDHAKKKLEAARKDHEKRLGGLQQIQELNVRRAEAIEANLERVEEAIAAVNGLIAQGMDWVEIARLIEMEQDRQNPVAEMIKLPLKLYENTATLLLAEADFEDELDYEGDETDEDVSGSDTEHAKASVQAADKRLSVDVDLALSPWSNARQYYEQKKTAAVKEQKTLQSSSKALKNTERKIKADLQKGLKQEKQVLRPVRKQLWFEKFIYFISSDGYLVLGGRDAQQNEILYKRYLKKGDVYVHADLHGAASVIIKNNPSSPDAPIPPSTLSQAGNFSVTTSSAWDSKAHMAAWWVNADQVSKTAPTGEYLTVGGFVIRGKKNFLPPAQLLLGFGVMFQISEESKAKHVKHRITDAEKPTADQVDETQPNLNATETENVRQTEGDSAHDDILDHTDDSPIEEDEAATESDEVERANDGPLNNNPLQTNGGSPPSRLEMNEDGSSSQEDEEPEPPEDAEGHAPDQDSDISEDENGVEDHSADHDNQEANSEAATISPTNPASNGRAKTGIRHLSAKERRLLRKGHNSANESDQSANATNNDSHDPTSDSAPQQHQGPSATPTTSIPKPPPPQHVRGKHGKRAKLKTKYAEQDEADRALAMRLLGSQAAAQKAQDNAQARQAREDEAAFQKARRREQHARTAQQVREHEEARRRALEEGVEAPDDDDDETVGMTTTALDAFVGTPLPGDELLAAVPVCAPWAALGNYKYRVKLQPGSVKKGKAVKEILHKWCVVDAGERRKVDEEGGDVERMWPREVELLRGWRETEVINVVPVSKVRVMMSGGAGAAGGKGGGQAKGKARGGKGSKKQR